MLYECPTCGREVSENASACPKCGEPDVGRKSKDHFRSVIIPAIEARGKESKRNLEENDREQRMLNRWAWAGAVIGGVLGFGGGGIGGLVGGAILGAIILRVVVIVIWSVFS